MGKILFKTEDAKIESTNTASQQFFKTFRSDRDVLKKRSEKYVKLLSSLDAKTVADIQGWNQLMDVVKEEFGTAELVSLPLGVVAKCFLGDQYEVHTLDLTASQIAKHFKIGEAIPGDFEKAITLAAHNAYAFIEVYTDKLVLIRADGSATKL